MAESEANADGLQGDSSTVDLLTEVMGAVAGSEHTRPIVDRLAALAALTGAPEPLPETSAPVVEVVANGIGVHWPDGDQPLVAGVVAFSVFQARVGGRTMQAYQGQTVHATEAVIARGVRLGALGRTA
ncbi:hypothetical protein ACQCSX_04425 [Pseudarthrobacter sp. P1]|uniref:hypothetical protein n=1 Tax=Pseudarthrobacter sp. P1 TaxID=3418418 RepID=UPI003CF5638D